MKDRITKPIKEVYRDFFGELKKYLLENSSGLEIKAINKNYMDISLVNKECHICVSSDSVRKELDIRIYISNNKRLFNELREKEGLINEKLGFNLEWRDPNEKSSYGILTEEWNHKLEFIADRSQKIYEALKFLI